MTTADKTYRGEQGPLVRLGRAGLPGEVWESSDGSALEREKALTVRVVPVRERRRPAWVVGSAGGLSLLWLASTHGPNDRDVLVAAGLFGAIWMLGLLLCWRPKPYLATVEEQTTFGGVRIGREWIPSHAEASIVTAKTGVSVAFVWPEGEVFIEATDLADAHALVSRVGARTVETFTLRTYSLVLRVVKTFAALAGAVACVVLATTPYESEVFSMLVASGMLTSAFHIIESVWKKTARIPSVSGREAARGSIAHHVLLHTTRGVPSTKEEPKVRVQVLDRGSEPMQQWLERIDMLAADAYRGDLPSRDELRAAFEDASLPIHQRVAAARLLVRRYSVSIDEIRRALDPEVVPYFLEVDHDDPARVARSVERLGPIFRP